MRRSPQEASLDRRTERGKICIFIEGEREREIQIDT